MYAEIMWYANMCLCALEMVYGYFSNKNKSSKIYWFFYEISRDDTMLNELKYQIMP